MKDTLNRVDNADTFVALDLETTGLNSDTDTIIEVGAVKFMGTEVLDTFHSLVNPLCPIPSFVVRLTGINQSEVDQAPVFSAISDKLVKFLGNSGMVGHNVKFDSDFLVKHGIRLRNECYDTWDLASMLLPYAPDYSLITLAEIFGVDHSRPHRALPDAEATFGVFCSLLKLMRNLDANWVVRINRLAKRANWPIHTLIQSAQRESLASSDIGPLGLDFNLLAERLTKPGKIPEAVTSEITQGLVDLVDNLQANSDFAKAFPGFEVRPQQKAMMRAVAGAFDSRQHLIVEGGTGVGKSMAYLVPSIVNSITCGTRVVISTNTINLQEQLLNNDIPAITKALEDANVIPQGVLRAAPLKGKTNYLCVRKWQQAIRSENISADDVRVIGKTLNWIHETVTGDKSEINLSGRDIITWHRISASDKGQCPGLKGSSPCFLKAARNTAEGAHIVVVNHALLLADLVLGGGLLPEYDHLVIDEAHHLEEQSTRQLGISMSEQQISELLGNLERTLGLLDATTRQLGRELTGLEHSIGLINDLRTTWIPRVEALSNAFWDSIHSFLSDHQTTLSEQQMLISNTSRVQPGWSTVEVSCENLNVGMSEGVNKIGVLSQLLESMSTSNREDLTDIISGLNSCSEEIYSLTVNLEQVVLQPVDVKRIDWIEKGIDRGLGSNARNKFVLNSAPLNVGTELSKLLFSKKGSVVLTSATLTANGTFDYIKDRLGVGECDELQVDSPFDYGRSALLVAPEGIPLPGEPGYSAAISKVITDLAIELNGHVMVLFTSHAALRATADHIRGPLGIHNVGVLAQGIDGSARQIVRKFSSNPKNILLGTSSLWEGVDLPGDQLTVLVLARLPFNVPTDPIFVARSTEYEDPFKDYALPQVILRLRQGIGRLIRRLTDRGAILILDRRLTTRSYSKEIIGSLPPCRFLEPSISEVPTLISRWLDNESNR